MRKKDYYVWLQWMQLLAEPYTPEPDAQFFEIFVPTKETVAI